MSGEFDIMSAYPGEHIANFAERMLREAASRRVVILGEHNDVTLEASHGDDLSAVLKPYNEKQKKSYFGDDR